MDETLDGEVVDPSGLCVDALVEFYVVDVVVGVGAFLKPATHGAAQSVC